MDIPGILAMVIGFILVTVIGIFLSGGNPMEFVQIASVLITIGGTTCAIIISSPWGRVVNAMKIVGIAFNPPKENPAETILMLVSFSEKARREGLLALEDDLDELKDDFLQKGIQLVVDGTDPELVRSILETDLGNIEARHGGAKQMFDDAGTFAPSFGMIGTLIGLIIMLKHIEDKSMLGSGMATALITTYYGTLLANLMFIPIANKLRERNNEEVLMKEIMIQGTLAIQSGDNPRIVKDRLVSFLPPALRDQVTEGVDERMR